MNKSILFIFTTLLVMSEMIQFTYEVGKASAPYIKMAVAFVITLVVYTYENWNKVEEAFVYTSPLRLKAPRYISAPRIRNTISFA